ncbi:MAG: glycosyltransferase [Crocinitomicaceae bacterium]|nr:glycosyltransferase [Crocinitomicaceae bacterium]
MTELNQHLDNGLFISCLTLFSLTILIQLYYIFFIFRRLAFYKTIDVFDEEIPLSIIIASRNDGEALQENLKYILNQKYSMFEVIVVNNNSIDNSKHVLSELEKEYNHLKVVEFNNGKHMRPGKKLPLTIGIKAAKNKHLIFTDADCRPASQLWLKTMAQGFSNMEEVILGYGPYHKTNGILNTIIRYDTAWIGMNYFSFALSKKPYMGVGRNLAYTKEAYLSVDGFKSHHSLASGDDDLFIQEVSKTSTLGIQIDPKSFCFSQSKKTYSDWINQKSRHYSTSTKYGFIKKLLLAIYPASLILAWFSFVSLMIVGNAPFIFITIMSLFYLLKWLIQGRCLFKLNERSFAFLFPFWDLFYSVLSPLIFIIGKTKRNNNW